MAVVDASVYVALVNARESEHARCWDWFRSVALGGESIVAPTILLAEVAAALSRGAGDPALAHRAARLLTRSGMVDLPQVTQSLAERAAEIAAEHRICGCDAVSVALADRAGDTLVTLDQQQLDRGAACVTVRAP